jgi:cell division protein FtsL
MKEVLEHIKKKSKIEKIMIIIMAISVLTLVAMSLAPLLYLQ